MIYLLYGQEKFLIEKEVKSILSNNKTPDINISKYNLNETLIDEIIDDAMTVSLFGDNKVIIVNDSDIFTSSSKKSSLEHDISKLEDYIHYNNPDTIIIFITSNNKLDARKKIVKLIKEKGVVKSFDKPSNISSTIKEMFDEYTISNKDINLLVDRVGKNLEILKQEIFKIKTYKENNKNITEEDIINLTSKNIDADIFELIDSIVNRNIEKSIEIYNELLKLNEEPIKIIVMLSNQIRLIYQTKELYKKGYTGKDIASTLNVHPYRITLALEKSRGYDSVKLISYLDKLADLDINIKSGHIDKNLGLELFILAL